MQTKDIKVGEAYQIEVGWRAFTKATVLETGVRHDKGYGRKRIQNNGVRCRIEEAVADYGTEHPVGEEITVRSLKVVRPWVPEDDERAAAQRAEEARKLEIERRLGEAGYTKDARHDGDYHWRGDRLALSPALTEELLEQAGI